VGEGGVLWIIKEDSMTHLRTLMIQVLVGQDGTVVNDTVTMPLGPGQQIARYVWQDMALTRFKGSLVLRGQNGQAFFATALLEKQGTYTLIPLIPGKARGVPD
jgi:hypothetical protein